MPRLGVGVRFRNAIEHALNTPHPSASVTLACDDTGRVCEVVHAELGAAPLQLRGRSLQSLLGDGPVQSADGFVQAVRQHGAAFAWELTLTVDGQRHKVRATGGRTAGGLLIVARTDASDAALFDEYVRGTNEIAAGWRSSSESSVRHKTVGGELLHEIKDELIAEMTRLNDELTATKHQLSRRVVELEQTCEAQTHQMRRLAALHESTVSVIGTLTIDLLATQLMDGGMRLMHGASGGLLLLATDDGCQVAAVAGAFCEDAMGAGFGSELMRDPVTRVLTGDYPCPRQAKLAAEMATAGSVLVAPFAGGAMLWSAQSADAFDSDAVWLAQAHSLVAAVSIRNARVFADAASVSAGPRCSNLRSP